MLFRSVPFAVQAISGLIALFVLGVSLWLWYRAAPSAVTVPTAVEISGRRFALEVAAAEKAREQGLSSRDSLCAGCAMLFVFEYPGQYAFWMKGMRFPLDIVWLAGDTVVFVAENVSPDFSGILESGISADRVIEFNAGMAKAEIGERVKFSSE